MKKSVFTGFIISGMLCSTLALAHANGGGKFMQFFDTNHDGIVTLDEFEAASKSRFDIMDADHNGVITEQEFRTYIKQRRADKMQAKLNAMDTNGDGQVSKAEYVAYQTQKAETRFAQMDKNNDGLLSSGELQTRHHRGHHNGKRLFNRLDKNGDGVISRDESHTAWSAWFARIDTNGDKVVTSDEVNAFREQRHAR